jgi:hypothetical protein
MVFEYWGFAAFFVLLGRGAIGLVVGRNLSLALSPSPQGIRSVSRHSPDLPGEIGQISKLAAPASDSSDNLRDTSLATFHVITALVLLSAGMS